MRPDQPTAALAGADRDVLIDLSRLSERELRLYYNEMETARRSLVIAYLLWALLGGLGAHHFYLRRSGWGWSYVALLVGGALTLPIGIGFASFAVLGFFELYDAFRLPRLTNRTNLLASEQIALRIESLRRVD